MSTHMLSWRNKENFSTFYTRPHDSGGVSFFHVGYPCGCPCALLILYERLFFHEIFSSFSRKTHEPCHGKRAIIANLYKGQVCASVLFHFNIATDKRGYPHNIFLISQRKHTLWVLIKAPRQGASNE